MFDSLPETKSGGAVVRGRAFSTAVIVHLGVLLALVSASVLAYVSPGEDPPVPAGSIIIITDIPKLGDDPEAGGRRHARPEPPPAAETPPPPETLVQPVPPSPIETPPVVPQDTPVAQPPVSESPDDGSEPGPVGPPGEGDGSGVGTGKNPGTQGVPWGKREGDSLSEGPGEPGDSPIIISPGVDAPVLLVRVEPDYPEIARMARIQGEVYLEGVIGMDGRVESVRTLKSVHPFLEDAARRAVRQWVYRPARQHGRVVKVYLAIRIVFQLN